MDAANLLNTVFAASAASAKDGKPGAGNDAASEDLFASLLTAPPAVEAVKTGAAGQNSGAQAAAPTAARPSGESVISQTPIAQPGGPEVSDPPIALPGGPPDGTGGDDGVVVTRTTGATYSGPGYQNWNDEELAARAEIQAAHRANIEALANNRWAKVFVRGKTQIGDFKGTAQDPMALNSFAHKMLNNLAARDAHQAAAAARRAVFANVTISPDGAQPNYHPQAIGDLAAGQGVTVENPAAQSSAASQGGTSPIINIKPLPGNLTGFDSHLAASAGTTPQALKGAGVTVTQNTQPAPVDGNSAAKDSGVAKSGPQAQASASGAGAPGSTAGHTASSALDAAAQIKLAKAQAGPETAKFNLNIRQNAAAPASTPGAQLAAAHAAAAAQRAGGTEAAAKNSATGGAAQTQSSATSAPNTPPGVAPLLQTAVTAPVFAGNSGDLTDQSADPDADLNLNGLSRGGETAHADRSGAAQQTQARSGPYVDAAAVAKLAKNIAKQAGNGARRFEIRMDPPELGKIEVKLEIGPDKKAHAMLMAERPETLADLQRSARALQRALAESGLELSQDGIEFGLSQDGGANGSGEFDERGSGGRAPLSAGPAMAESTSEAAPPPMERSIDAFGFRLAARSGANVRI